MVHTLRGDSLAVTAIKTVMEGKVEGKKKGDQGR